MMIKFFRHFRMRILSENKFSKYLIYAIGEIVLVVIGILIALQINNWNENQKERQLEIGLLKGFEADLKTDSLYLNELIKEYAEDQLILDSITTMLFESTSKDTEKFLTWNSQIFILEDYFQPTTATYDESQSSGRFQFITNDSLRRRLYDYYFWVNSYNVDKINREMTFTRAFPYFFDKFGASKETFLRNNKDYNLPSIDLESLKNDKLYISRLVERATMQKYQVQEYRGFLKEINELLNFIEKELKTQAE